MNRLVLIFLAGYLTAICSCVQLPRRLVTNDASQLRATPDGNLAANGININTASLTEIEKLPGIGEVLAGRIIAHRQEHGPFRRVEHLMMVRGISDRKFREIRSLVRAD
jgi:competence ComEA-like helix-hairpin-helix protein